MSIDIQTFTSNGTWTKPANAYSCQVLVADGGNGGDGGGYDSGTKPGAGGYGSPVVVWQLLSCMLPSTMAVVVGAGGAGGAGAIDASPGTGVVGGASNFGILTTALIEAYDGSRPNGVISGYGLLYSTGGLIYAESGGTGGDPDGVGANGAGTSSPFDSTVWPNGGAGGIAGGNGTSGGNLDIGGGGGGGGGGAITATSKGGNGGKGGAYGGGGGGGGSGDGTFTGGDGGAGGDGVVIVWTTYEGSSGGGLTAQQTRDAMKLAPSTGAGVTGSIDDLLITTGVALKNDAITASKFDESTAFPITATDSGSTYLARTGADSDTLETLSDEIAAVSAAIPSAATIADAVWDEASTGHTSTGKAGEQLWTDVDALATTLTAMKGAGWTTETLVAILAAIGSAGLTAQQVRDAMKLAPTAGSPSAGSVDAHLDSLIAGVSGAGAVECAITVNDGTNPVDGAEVWVTTDASGTNTVASGTSDALGLVTVWLDAGSYYVWKQLAGYTFTNPQVMVVT